MPNTSTEKQLNSTRRKETHAKLISMALTRDFKETIVECVERDPEFTKTPLDEPTTLFLSDEPETALWDLVNATPGFEHLAKLTEMPSKSLQRMLSPRGNPSMDNLAAIFAAVSSRRGRAAGSSSEGCLASIRPAINDPRHSRIQTIARHCWLFVTVT